MVIKGTGCVSESRLYMLRAIVALAHSDGILEPAELDLLSDTFTKETLAPGQREILMRDLSKPQDVRQMFGQVSNLKDKKDFFDLADHMNVGPDGRSSSSQNKLLNELALAVKKPGNESSALEISCGRFGAWLSNLMQPQSG